MLKAIPFDSIQHIFNNVTYFDSIYNFYQPQLFIQLVQNLNIIYLRKNQKMLRKIWNILPLGKDNEKSTVESIESIGICCEMFYQKFMFNHCFIDAKVTKAAIHDGIGNQKSYGIYQISVLTEDVYYFTQKRYSQFKTFYHKIQKIVSLNILFPQKKWIQCGTDISVISQRMKGFRQFIQRVKDLAKVNVKIASLFYDFLEIHENYRTKNIIIKNEKQSCNVSSIEAICEYMNLQVIKINYQGNNILYNLKCIEQVAFQIQNKITVDTIRILFLGIDDRQGIIQSSIKNPNYLIVIQGLKLIYKLINHQQNIPYKKYLKVFLTVPIQFLKPLVTNMFNYPQFRQIHYNLISLYTQNRKNKQLILRQVYGDNIYVYQHYQKKLQIELSNDKLENFLNCKKCKSQMILRLSNKVTQKQQKEISRTLLIQQSNKQIYTFQQNNFKLLNDYKLVYEANNNQQSIKICRSKQDDFLRIDIVNKGCYNSIKKTISSLKQNNFFQSIQFQRQKLYGLVNIKTQNMVKSIKLKIQEEEKHNFFRQILSPVRRLVGSISFYQLYQISLINPQLIKVKIQYFFIGSVTKNLFNKLIIENSQIIQKVSKIFNKQQ